MNEERILLYRKAVNRLKKSGIIDPTSVIAELESEIDSYRTKLKKIESQNRLDDIQAAIGKINHNAASITKEDDNYLYVTNLYGTHKYSKIQLSIFWLTHSNECFYETFGFSWIPSDKLQKLAREKLNKNSSVTIGVDIGFGNDMQVDHIIPLPDTILKDILSDINPVDIVGHRHSFTSFHTK